MDVDGDDEAYSLLLLMILLPLLFCHGTRFLTSSRCSACKHRLQRMDEDDDDDDARLAVRRSDGSMCDIVTVEWERVCNTTTSLSL